jgi:hypothetical protein
MATIQKLGGGLLNVGGANGLQLQGPPAVQQTTPPGQVFQDGFGFGQDNNIMGAQTSGASSSGSSIWSTIMSVLQGLLGMLPGGLGSMLSSALGGLSSLFGK